MSDDIAGVKSVLEHDDSTVPDGYVMYYESARYVDRFEMASTRRAV